ncbi:aminotransferase class III-fold pyridoxal phosphate-dependent enzyme, partial [Myxococcota bacterium]|nr:aminotransferase class III-fold pyridoxal phosphate-dependent enzyme [Myxococcota bacterium]
ALCDEFGALLVFDEVMTGFRVARGGAQRLYGIRPDLTTLGKVVGGGLPAAAYGGRRDLMSRIAPEGDVYQAGTLSGNPLAVAAGLTTLRLLEAKGVYETLAKSAQTLATGLLDLAREQGIPFTTASVGGMFGFFFHPGPVESFAQAQQSDAACFRRFFAAMLESGIYLAPSPYEAAFVSLAHRPRDLEQTLEAARKAFQRSQKSR